MKSIEEIKIDITLKILRGEFNDYNHIQNLPVDDELRTFICGISPRCAYMYANLVDRKPHSETRTASCKDPGYAYLYARNVDERPNNETKEAACRVFYWGECYRTTSFWRNQER